MERLLRAIAYVSLALMGAAILYVAVIGFVHWNGIGV